MRVLLVGNPNVGKSVIFSRLTGARVIVSNYPGTTVEFVKGCLRIEGREAEVVDVPGTYSLEPSSDAEAVASRMLAEGDVIVNVVDATNLERNLYLTLELLNTGKPVVVALNMFDDTAHRGIEIDVPALQKALGVPVVCTCGLSGEGIRELVSALVDARANTLPHSAEERWSIVGNVIQQVQTLAHRHHTVSERLADLSVQPSTGIPMAIVVALVSFEIIRLIGESTTRFVLDPAFENWWRPVVAWLSDVLSPGTWIHSLLIGTLFNGRVDFEASMGLLTTALYIPMAVVLPYILAFYLVLSILEDTGYLPRVAIIMDTFMHRLGLHGMAVIPMLLGLGCNVPGALATRILETRRQRFVAATMMAICVPCMAQTAMVFALLGKYGVAGLAPVFVTLFLLWVGIALGMKFISPSPSPEVFVEIPRYRRPYARAVAQKVWLRIRQFVAEAIPFVALGVLVINVLHTLHVLDWLGHLFMPITTTLLGLPEEAVATLLVGFLRKDLAVGMLLPLDLTMKQLIVGSVVLVTYFPCAATFTVLLKEFGFKSMLKASTLMVAVSLSVGTVLNLVL